jgi:hypothetical protein
MLCNHHRPHKPPLAVTPPSTQPLPESCAACTHGNACLAQDLSAPLALAPPGGSQKPSTSPASLYCLPGKTARYYLPARLFGHGGSVHLYSVTFPDAPHQTRCSPSCSLSSAMSPSRSPVQHWVRLVASPARSALVTVQPGVVPRDVSDDYSLGFCAARDLIASEQVSQP